MLNADEVEDGNDTDECQHCHHSSNAQLCSLTRRCEAALSSFTIRSPCDTFSQDVAMERPLIAIVGDANKTTNPELARRAAAEIARRVG